MVNYLENQLIARCQNGDTAAFGLLVQNYRRQLYSYLLKLSGDRFSAEDLFQETLIRVWRSIPKYNNKNKFSSWLFSIAHNLAIDSFRKRKVKNIFHANDEANNFIASTNHEKEIEFNETKMMLQQAVLTLPEKQKEVFLLRQHGEMTFKEIAKTTDQPLNTVLSHMNYAVKKLKKVLREENAA